jgi:pyruvate/2-oxoglutarate dehydrogenase complex dihydrolipoamide acyltransferase (E2) component
VSRAQRLGFLAIAAVIAVVAVIVLSSSGGDDEPPAPNAQAKATATPSATAPAEPEPTATETPTPEPQPALVSPGKVTRLRFSEGDTVRFRVRSDTADHVHVHGYDLMKDVVPGKTITFSFPAKITGIFEVELEDAGEQIAQLRVDPK